MKKSVMTSVCLSTLSLGLLLTACSKESSFKMEQVPQLVHYDQVEAKVELLNLIMREESRALNSIRYQASQLRGVDLSEEASSDELQRVGQSLGRIVSSTKVVLNEYGVSEQELTSIFGTSDDPRIALMGIIFVDLLNREASRFRDLEWDDFVDCAMGALGLNLFSSIRSRISSHGLRHLTKAAAMAAVRRIATRMAGVLGVGITVAEFGWCLYRAD